MLCDLGGHHVPLALANHGHVDRAGLERPAVFRGVTHKMGDPRALNLIFARHAGDVGTGAADPFAFHDGAVRLLPSARQRACRQFRCRGRGYRTVRVGPWLSPFNVAFACAGRPMGPQAHSAFEAEHDEAVFAVRYICLGICSTTGNAWPLSGGLGRRIRSDRLERRRRQPNHGKRVYTPCLTVLAATSVTDDC
jgi:hypothetical protein